MHGQSDLKFGQRNSAMHICNQDTTCNPSKSQGHSMCVLLDCSCACLLQVFVVDVVGCEVDGWLGSNCSDDVAIGKQEKNKVLTFAITR